MTHNQNIVLIKVAVATDKGQWYRAAGSGERVTLASLYRRQWLKRRAHRGIEGEADAAYEYQSIEMITSKIVEMIRELQRKRT